MANSCLLVGDIGGTNARFALADPNTPGFSQERVYACADFASPSLAIDSYLKEVEAPRPGAICLAAAGPVTDGMIRFLNNDWTLGTSELKHSYAGAVVRLMNDFEAVAWSIPHLRPEDYMPVGRTAATA